MASRVKSKAPNPQQITAEQLLREAWERREPPQARAPAQRIADVQELMDYRQTRRKEFEDRLRANRTNVPTWLKYAKWEISQQEFSRARSIFERAIEVDYRNHSIWLAYAEFEMKHRFVNHARNVWDRAVALLPRVDQLWYKYAYMEEMLGNVAGARLVYARWMRWMPGDSAWTQYVNFELRRGEIDKARTIFQEYTQLTPTPRAFVRFARFEERHARDPVRARTILEQAAENLPETALDAHFFVSFAKFEERGREIDRARAVLQYALQLKLPGLHEVYSAFEKQHGAKADVENVVVEDKRRQYQDRVDGDSLDYDTWFDWTRLEESVGDPSRIRETYERAISCVPPGTEKRNWQRYVYLWINYAVWEELSGKRPDRAAEVYASCLRAIPDKHSHFSFSKVWLLAADLEVRRNSIESARSLLGRAIAFAPKPKIFRRYIGLELSLGEIDRCRRIYCRWVEVDPSSTTAWTEFAEAESSWEEFERARSIFQLGVSQHNLDYPESLWKAFIEFEVGRGEVDKARALHERLVEESPHLKTWTDYALFEEDIGSSTERTREVFRRGSRALAEGTADDTSARNMRAALLETWLDFETRLASNSEGPNSKHFIHAVTKLLPRKLKRKRAVRNNNGEAAGWEEYEEYVFPEEESKKPRLALLEAAHAWKKQQGT